jgi:hypothetical protein
MWPVCLIVQETGGVVIPSVGKFDLDLGAGSRSMAE